MTVGKPDFNLNSFGVKYLSKDEVQAFLNKFTDTNADATGKYGVDNQKKPNAPVTSPYSPIGIQADSDPKKLEQNPKGKGKPVVNVTNNEAPKVKPDENTKYIFNAPTYGIPDTRKRQTTNDKLISGTIGVKQAKDTRGYGSTETAARGVGNAPEELSDSLNTEPMKQGKSTVEVGVGSKAKEVFDKKDGVGEKYVKQYDSKGKKISAKARKENEKKESEAKSKREKETKINQVKEKLKLQEAQNKKIKQPDLKGSTNTPEDISTKEVDVEEDVPTESEASFKRRSAANEIKRQADAAKKKEKKLTDDEKMTKIVEEHRSTRGLGKSADETIFKAISLKLDLMKGVKSKRHNYTKLTSAGKNPAKKLSNASEALGAAYASGKMTENSVDADTNTETGATGKPKGSVADQYT